MHDYHLHLSGATDPAVLYEIIREAGLKTGAKDYWEFEKTILMNKESISSLDQYLKVLHTIDEAQSSPLAIERCVYNAYVSSYLVGCTYLELRWNCTKRSQKGRIDLDSLIVAARAGYEKANTIFGIKGGMIFCLGRDCNEQENEALFKKALQYRNKGVIGLDIAGPEKKPISKEFVYYYRAANASKMVTTCHVGEVYHEGVEDEIAFVLEKLKPQRIGHGIQIRHFPKLLKKAASMNIQFEICITSNLTTRAVKDYNEFREIFKTFEEYSIDYTINTDSTFPMKTNIRREHEIFEAIKANKYDKE